MAGLHLQELLWLFLVYSFLGWILETVTAAFKHRHFLNRGLINGPLCIIYGVTVCVVTIFFHEMHGIWLFFASVIMSTLIEWTAGNLIERYFHERWWDYSDHRWNLEGTVSLTMSLFWGALCTVCISWGNGLLVKLYHWFPGALGKLGVSILMGVLLLDAAASVTILEGRSKNLERWESLDAWLDSITSRLGKKIYRSVNRRIMKAYPEAVPARQETAQPEVFAYGCSFYKLWLLFVIGAFLGDLTETVFCRITGGVWMSRSSVVWGPFSIVWGLGMAAATFLLYQYKERSAMFLFTAGTFLGGAYEYICSVFTELMFGQVFWDYSEMPFNLGGRINLLYCFFWGFAAVAWMKGIFPKMSDWIEKIPVKCGKMISWLLVLFMSCNILVSCMALIRVEERQKGIEAQSRWQQVMDERFDDARMQRIYPNAIHVE